MTEKEFYTLIGGNYEEALSRLMRDSLIRKFVIKFKSDPTFSDLSAAIGAGAWDNAFPLAHTLKGVVMNLAFTSLAGPTVALTDLLRPQNRDAFDPDRARELFGQVAAAYDAVCGAISLLEQG